MGARGVERNRKSNDSMKKVETNDVVIDTDSECTLGDGSMHLTSTMPVVDDNYLLEDAYETQVVDLDGETQVVMTCTGETQVIDSGETQALDDVDCIKRTPSECLEKFNAEDDAMRLRLDASGASTVTVTNGEHSGSADRDFTSIRAESFRASGLAARARGANKNSSSSDKSSIEQLRFIRGGSSIIGRLLQCGSKNSEKHLQSKDSGASDKLETRKIYKSGSTVVRKLFLDGEVSQVNNLDNQSSSQNPLVGLRYVDSQEPGEQSQAEALEVVDKFLSDNMETNEPFSFLIHDAGKPSFVSAAKGSRDLAKVSILKKITAQQGGIYDWDGSREDECGGEFLQKKRELLFGTPKQKCISEPQKRKCSVTKSVKNVPVHDNEKEQNLADEKGTNGFHSDSRSMQCKRTAKRKVRQSEEEKLSKNLDKDFDDGLTAHCLVDNEDSSKGVAHVDPIGPDTQLAVEAMENLCFEVSLSGNVGVDSNKFLRSTTKATRKNRSAATVDHTEECLTVEKQCLDRVGAVTRLAKRRKTTSLSTGNEFYVSAKKAKNVKKRSRKELEKVKRETSNVSTLNVMESTDQSVGSVADHENEKEQNLAEEKVINGFPSDLRSMSRKMRAKHRVRQSEDEKLSKNLDKEINDRLKTSSVHRLADNDSSEDINHVETIGPDTQLAAEAMGTLCFEVPLAGNVGVSCTKVKRSKVKATKKNKSAATVDHTDGERLAKCRKTTSVSTGNEVYVSAKEAKKVTKRSHSHKEVGKEKQATPNVSTVHVIESTGQVSEKELDLEKQPYLCSPVAHRTRKRSQTSCAKAAGDSSVVGEELSDTLSARLSRKLKTSAKYKNVESDVVTKGRKLESSESKKSRKRLVAKSEDSDVDVTEHLKEKEIVKEKEKTSPQETCKTSDSSYITPPFTKRMSVSPLCGGDEYHKQSCRTKLSRSSLVREIENLLPETPKNLAHTKDLRKRKDVSNVRVLFSQHLEDDTVKKQKKILGRLGGAVASSISDATHFVADELVRTRNMLEAIAFGKPVITHLWLEGCGQSSCLIDEKNYILRDARKEKEFGFSLPASLLRAREHPLLQGYKVFITPNCKPGKDILAYLVKAVHGLVVERLGRSVLNSEELPDALLILSCEDDYDLCIPFLEKGGRVYSSELLLNGVVKQKLEFERHLIFTDKVKRTRSTIWLKKKNRYLPVMKS